MNAPRVAANSVRLRPGTRAPLVSPADESNSLRAGLCLLLLLAAFMTRADYVSSNAVGFVDLQLTNGWNLIANQLDYDGTGTNNTLYTVFGTNLPNAAVVLAWNTNTSAYASATYNADYGYWNVAAADETVINRDLSPGAGVWVQYPTSGTLTFTLSGIILQGNRTNQFVNASGYSIVSSIVPQYLTTGYGLTAKDQDVSTEWNAGSQSYPTAYTSGGTFDEPNQEWSNGEPLFRVTQARWYRGHSGSKWVRNFVVQ
jgi:hypothetical protein